MNIICSVYSVGVLNSVAKFFRKSPSFSFIVSTFCNEADDNGAGSCGEGSVRSCCGNIDIGDASRWFNDICVFCDLRANLGVSIGPTRSLASNGCRSAEFS